MKRISFAFLLLFCVTAFAQQGINYKALIKDGSGNLVASTLIQVEIIILDGALNIYEETHAPTTDANGIVILNIGEGATVSGDFSTIDWSSANHKLNVKIDTGGGLQDMGETPFKMVPYAMHSATATVLTGGIDQAYIDALEARIAALESGPAAVGDLRVGGVVFWVDPLDNHHGLVCALSDYVNTRTWGCLTDLPNVPNVPSGPTGPGAEIGDGLTNTTGILLNDCPNPPAALAARSDGPEWFLPSVNELNEMYVNKAALEAVPGFTPFQNNYYWSSTEKDVFHAWEKNFNGGNQNFGSKGFSNYVRAVRVF